MKVCPKCNTEHDKLGTFCSRNCANSRVFSEEAKQKKRVALKGRKQVNKNQYDRAAWASKIKEAWLVKYNNTPFDQLGVENRRRRVFEEQNHCCNKCKLATWFDKAIVLELEHKDGNNQNNIRENLEGLCPNCHSITDTWRGRNKPNKNGVNKITDDSLLKHLIESNSIRQGLLKAGLSAKGKNYERAKKLLNK